MLLVAAARDPNLVFLFSTKLMQTKTRVVQIYEKGRTFCCNSLGKWYFLICPKNVNFKTPFSKVQNLVRQFSLAKTDFALKMY